MARDLERWLPMLDAPSGGELRLADALHARHAESQAPWRPALAAVCCVLLVALALPKPGARATRPDIARALDLPPPPAVQVEDGAALEVPVAAENVRVVWVMNLGEGPSPR